MALVEIKNVVKEFKQGEITVPALRGINLEIEEAEFTAIVGPSGSGKTTLLNLVGALDKVTRGAIVFDGVELGSLNKAEASDIRLHKLGFIFQAYNLVPVMTAAENVEYVLMLQGMPKYQRREKVHHIFNAMSITELKDRLPRKMSGGQQQRVAVARALVSEPRLVLADEPTANLDGENAETLLNIMQKMGEESKTTFLFSTHDERVMRKARRIVSLKDGMVVSDEIQT